jgi:acyl-CoA thioesterase-2
VSSDWEIWGPNGGYIASLALRAAGEMAAIKRPVSFYCHFIRSAQFEPVELQAEIVQQGRRAESIRIGVSQRGKIVLAGLLRTAAICDGIEHDEAPADAPAPESLPTLEELYPEVAAKFTFWRNVETRIIQPERSRRDRLPAAPRLREWYRFRPRATFDDPFVDAARSLVLLDTLGWPAAWQHHPGTGVIAPSLDVAAFFHRPAQHSEWLLVDHASPSAAEGLVGTHGRVYDRAGRLVASGGSQLLCVPANS